MCAFDGCPGLWLFGIAALPTGKRNEMLARALDGLLGLFRDRVLPFDTDAARRYAELAITAKTRGRGFLTPDGLAGLYRGVPRRDRFRSSRHFRHQSVECIAAPKRLAN